MNAESKENAGPSSGTLLILLLRKLGLPASWIRTSEERRKHLHRVEGGRRAWETRKARRTPPQKPEGSP